MHIYIIVEYLTRPTEMPYEMTLFSQMPSDANIIHTNSS